MNVLLHTICLEPARWTPRRVSQPLATLLPAIAGAGFRQLEVFEPHLALDADEAALPGLFAKLGLEPVVLSSYLNLAPAATTDADFEKGAEALETRVARFGFRKVRLFSGMGIQPTDEAAIAVVQARVAALAQRLPGVEFLLETHDGSIADAPERIVQFVKELALPNVGLLFQPTLFEHDASLSQLALQEPYIRHVHLQNRAAGDRNQFRPLAEGAVPWRKIIERLAATGRPIEATLEFIPSAICTVEAFDLKRSIAEAVAEAQFIRGI